MEKNRAIEQYCREKANKMVWSPDAVRRERARTKSVMSRIDAVQKAARETQAYMDRNDGEAIKRNKWEEASHLPKDRKKWKDILKR